MPRMALGAVVAILLLAALGLPQLAFSRPDETPRATGATARPAANCELPAEPAVQPAAPTRYIGAEEFASPEVLPPIPALPAFNDLPQPARLVSYRTGVRIVRMKVTAYCPCMICCGSHACGITASGRPVTVDHGRFVAADLSVLPFRTRLIVPGYANDSPVRVRDSGGAIVGRRLDVFFRSHKAAAAWGVRWLDVTVLDY